jgi:hypothetical protein
MKLFLPCLCLATVAFANKGFEKCKQIPKGGKRRYTTPRTIERGNNQPAAIQFLQDNRDLLMSIFEEGDRPELNTMVGMNLWTLGKFSDGVGDPLLGQVYRQSRQRIAGFVREGEELVKMYGEEFSALYRDNTQRLTKVLADVAFHKDTMEKFVNNEEWFVDVVERASSMKGDGAKVYQNFLNAHGDKFLGLMAEKADLFAKFIADVHASTQRQVFKVVKGEKQRANYRQVVDELPLVYQFFNDNIEYVQMQNMDKELDEAVVSEIMDHMAKNDKQIASMIRRHQKFIKKMMMDRTMEQQKNKAVQAALDKTKELKESADNQAEFDRIVAEKKKAGVTITEEIENQIWNYVKSAEQKKQKEENGNQLKPGKKGNTGMTRYEHLAALMGLMPDDLEETISEMVKESCPELDLIDILTPEMKAIVEAQPENFIDQLIKELHDVCDMFGLIDESKVFTKNVNGVEIQFYAADWHSGEKVQW